MPPSLIVNADDFGFTEGVNRGIVEAHEHGIVTSASLMVDRPGAAQAGAYGRSHDRLDVGLHVDLEHWRVRWRPWGRARAELRLAAAVKEDVMRQVDRFRLLVGRDPTHLDSHHHRHRAALLQPVFREVAGALDVPLREFHPEIRFCGWFYGQADGRPNPDAITPPSLIRLLESLEPGVTELCSHPGYTDGLTDWYREERLQEVRTLCDPSVVAALERLGIALTTFREVSRRGPNPALR